MVNAAKTLLLIRYQCSVPEIRRAIGAPSTRLRSHASSMSASAGAVGTGLLGSQCPGCLDQFLDRSLVFPAGLQEIDANCVTEGHICVGRIRVELLESGDQFETADLTGSR